MTLTLTKKLSTGQVAEIHTEGILAFLTIDGKRIAGGSTAPIKLQQPKGDITHWMGGNAGKVGLTAAEAKLVKDATKFVREGQADPATTWMGEASMDAAESIF